jgi:hypothetical protein
MLTLEVVTPDGVVLLESDVQAIVVRRRETAFDVGSEVAILPDHAPMLVRLPIAPARFTKKGCTVYMSLCGGFVEVFHHRVTAVTPRCASVSPDEPDPVGAAWNLCERWRAQAGGSREEMVGVASQPTRGARRQASPLPTSR